MVNVTPWSWHTYMDPSWVIVLSILEFVTLMYQVLTGPDRLSQWTPTFFSTSPNPVGHRPLEQPRFGLPILERRQPQRYCWCWWSWWSTRKIQATWKWWYCPTLVICVIGFFAKALAIGSYLVDLFMAIYASEPRPHQQIWIDGAPLDAPPVSWSQKLRSASCCTHWCTPLLPHVSQVFCWVKKMCKYW